MTELKITRKSIPTQLRDAGVKFESRTGQFGNLVFVVDGVEYTPGEAANELLASRVGAAFQQVPHATKIEESPGHGYVYRATCSCGWVSWRYVAEHAARDMADAHKDGEA